MATQVKNILIVVVFSLFLALGLNPIVEWLVRRGVKRGGLALILVILVGLGVLVLAGWAIVPRLRGPDHPAGDQCPRPS